MGFKKKLKLEPNKTIKGFKVRLYPNEEQEKMFYKHIHACRFIWNHMLTLQQKHHKETGKRYKITDLSYELTVLKHKEEYSWLNDVCSHSLLTIIMDLDDAYKRYKKKISELPKLKRKKKAKKSFPTRYDRLYFIDGTVNIEKVGRVKYKSDREIPEGRGYFKFYNPRISLVNNKWILSFSMECDKQTPSKHLAGDMGIDMGIRRLATVSYCDKAEFIPNINKSEHVKTLRHKLKYLQRKVAKIYLLHGNYNKTKNILRIESQIREIYYHLSCIVKDYNNKQTRYLVELCPKRVIMEDIKVKKLVKKTYRNIRREIYNASWYDFRHKMELKCNEYGIEFILADKLFPSTQLCHNCGSIKKGKNKLTLKDTHYICDKCGYVNDRDINAALNLQWYIV